jgi:hypothetical protein
MKKALFLLIAFSISTIAQDNRRIVTSVDASGSSFTNSAGNTYTVEELARSLRDLQAAIDRTMPVLTALNETYSNSLANQSLTGKLTGLLSGALNRNSSSTSTANTNSGAWSSAMARLQGLLGTNSASGELTLNANTERDLLKLRDQLQPVQTSLSKIGLGQPSDNGVAGRGYQTTNSTLTPTGR